DSGTQLAGGRAKPNLGRNGIGISPAKPQRVYAVVDADPDGGIYRSEDAGASWTHTSNDRRVWERGWYFGAVTVEPDNTDVVYSVNVNVYRSSDGGKVFVPFKGAP